MDSSEIPDLPGKGDIRVILQIPCGCQSVLDFPQTFFTDAVNKGIPEDHAVDFVLGYYGGDLFRQLMSIAHGDNGVCPADYDAVLTEVTNNV